MKSKNILLLISSIVSLLFASSCSDDYLDRQPLSNITPENYLKQEADLASYVVNLYSVFPTDTWDPWCYDDGTDDMASNSYNNKYVPGQWKVGQSGGEWDFTNIYNCNYFLQTVLPRYKAGELTGADASIKHDIGEMYLIRAYVYFTKLQAFGDFPIVKSTLPTNKADLIAASKRIPRTEVARFIISDLDSAIMLMQSTSPDGNRNRLSRPCAQLLKSRVALYEATWLKNFKGTAFVPNGKDWPGTTKDYDKNYTYPSGSIDNEISYLLGQAMEASKVVADAIPLTENNKVLQQSTSDPVNPFCAQYGAVDMAPYQEIMFWRRFDLALGVCNNIAVEMGYSNNSTGLTKGLIDSYVMQNGLPIYASGSGYHGDDSIPAVRKDRDYRLFLFLKQPGMINILYPSSAATHAIPIEPLPDILNKTGNAGYPTGYSMRKALNFDAALDGNCLGYTGEIVFLAAEAYLNYIEASYEKNGTIDADASKYWKALRNRAGVDNDFQKTIDATDMTIEAKGDWGAYSAGKLINPTLYNIRRERRCELMGMGLRMNDLRRWRSLDQMVTTPYHIEGFKLWGPMQHYWDASELTYGIGDKSRVSSPALSNYLRPYEKTPTNLAYGGYKWAMAHYLCPIAIQHFLITSTDGKDISTSPIYQNPGWPTTPNVGPTY